jgi:biopolymer transport protein ExbD
MPKIDVDRHEPRSGGGRRARRTRVSTSLAEINVVPLVDVMLVLLVIFMVAAPMMTQGFPVQLPESRRSVPLDQRPVTISVPASFSRDGQVWLGDERVGLDVLAERVRQELSGQVQRNVVLAGDGSVTLQELLQIFDRLRDGDVTNIGIQTQPPRGRRP